MQTLAKFIYFKVLKWRIIGDFPQVAKAIVIAVPHTSWLDFFLGLIVRMVWKEEINFIAKKRFLELVDSRRCSQFG